MREATIHIPHGELDALGIGTFVSRCLDAGIREFTELACRGDGCLYVVTLDAELPDGAFDDVGNVHWTERLSTGGDGAAYLCKVSTTRHGEGFESITDLDASSEDVRVDDRGLDISLVGSQGAIARSVAEYDAVGASVTVRKLTDYTGPDASLDAVTGRQREVLEVAYEMGYFEVPREASAAAVAAELDLDPSTVTEHLRRAERNVMAELLE